MKFLGWDKNWAFFKLKKKCDAFCFYVYSLIDVNSEFHRRERRISLENEFKNSSHWNLIMSFVKSSSLEKMHVTSYQWELKNYEP